MVKFAENRLMAEDWSVLEVEAVVSDYFVMLSMELSGISYNKAEHNRNLRKIIRRSRGAIEFKHQNISAVLIELGFVYIRGYKPYPNLQDLLRIVVRKRLDSAKQLHKLAQHSVEEPIKSVPVVKDILSILVPPPIPKKVRKNSGNKPTKIRKSPPRNYLEIEARNRSLGLAGEYFAIEYEQARLWRAGKKKLSNRIDHVARTKGDYLGFDIISFEVTGQERLIEVKTTRLSEYTPFFASRNEVNVSEFRSNHYHLYRLFNFHKKPEMFILGGSLDVTCDLKPTIYSATLKSLG